MGEIVAIVQHKGGTGKTSTTLNLGAALAEIGKRVLLVDLDPQADLSAGLGVDVDTARSRPNLYTILASEEGSIRGIIAPTSWSNLALVPGTLDMADLELYLSTQMGRERVLETALTEVLDDYDYILLDCPPSLGLITVNALVAASYALVTAQAQPRSVRATERMLSAIETVRRKLKHPELKVVGLLVTMIDSNNVSREAATVLREAYNGLVFETNTARRVRVPEDTLYRAPVLAFAPKSESAAEMRHLASEVVMRIEGGAR
jgi:chromosome partitioning protein